MRGFARLRSAWARHRTLVGLFLARFFDNELVGGSHDLKTSFFALLAFLAAPGALIPILLAEHASSTPGKAHWGWSMVARYDSPEALRLLSLTDKTFYLGCALVVTGILTTLIWNSLLPSRRDALVLGSLPVRPSAIVGARLVALAGYVAIVAVAMHALASLSFGLLLAANNTFGFALRGIAAHFVASCAASAFVFGTVVGVQGLVVVVTGPQVFARVSAVLQMLLVMVVVALMLAVPVISRAVGPTLGQADGTAQAWILWTPALWFLGLYESLLGTSDPRLIGLGWTAVVAVGSTIVVTLGCYPLVYRRLSRAAVETGEFDAARTRSVLPRLVAVSISRDPRVRAIAEFFLLTVTRVDRQRFIMAASIGLTATWVAASFIGHDPGRYGLPSLSLLSGPVAALMFLLAGMRLSAALPADAAAAWLFHQAAPTTRQARQAMERTMAVVVVLPVLGASTAVFWMWWGRAFALTHAAIVASLAVLLLESLLWRFASVPCTRPWRPAHGDLRRWWPAYVVGFTAITSLVAGTEGLAAELLLAPSAAGPLLPGGLVYVVSIVIGLFLGLALLVRKAAATEDAALDDNHLGILSDALQSAAETHARAPLAREAVDPAHPTRRISVAGSFIDAPRAETEPDPWYADLSVRPAELWHDLRYGVRRLSRAPAFTLLSVLSLSLGMGATTTMYALAGALTRRPMQIADASRVMTVRAYNRRGDAALSWLDFQDVRAGHTSFAAVEASSGLLTSLSGRDQTTEVDGVVVTGGYFPLLGVNAAIGRTLQATDDQADAPPAVVLSESAWRMRFAGDPAIVGTPVRIGGDPYTVVGVLPSSFRGVHTRLRQPALWTTLAHAPRTDPAVAAHRDRLRRDHAYLQVVARLRPQVTEGVARSEVEGLSRALDAAAPLAPRAIRPTARGWTIAPITAEDAWSTQGTTMRLVIMLLPAVVLLVACTNLANLVLARGAARRRDLAIRRAIGSSRWSVVRGQLVEHGLVTLVGGLGGLALARVAIVYVSDVIARSSGYGPAYQIDPRVDLATVGATFMAVAVAFVVAGLWPAVQLTGGRADLTLALKPGSGMSAGWRGRAQLIAFQVAASVALLLVAALCVRAILATDATSRIHMNLASVAAVNIAPALRTHDEAQVTELADSLVGEARRTVGIQEAAAVSGLPGMGDGFGVRTTTSGRPFDPDARSASQLYSGTAGMFAVLGVPLVAGRAFDDADSASAGRVAIISQAEAQALFGGAPAVGRDLQMSASGALADVRSATIVGVVGDAASDRDGHPSRDVYVPFAQRPDADLTMLQREVTMLARSGSSNVGAAVEALRSAIRRADPDLAVTFAGSATTLAADPGAGVLSLIARIAGALALVSLALSMAGLYGVVSHVVAARTRELGIRMALGADRRRILRLVFEDGARPVVKGLVIGLVVAALSRMALQSYFTNRIAALDLVAVVLAVMPLLAAASIACYLPAQRAARVNPATAIKDAD